MTRQQTGTNYTLTPSRPLLRTIRAVLLSLFITSAVHPLRGGEVYGQAVPLVCGMPLAEHLTNGGPDAYLISALPTEAVLVEAIDTTLAGSIGNIKLTATPCSNPAGCFACGGTLIAPAGTSIIQASDCIGADSGSYTISLAVVSDGPDNCGAPLPCRTPLTGVALTVPGEVDSYTFPGVQGDTVTLTVAPDTFRTRVFDPTGTAVALPGGEECTGKPVGITLPLTGTYTVLVSACTVPPQTGAYTITWQPPTCPVVPAHGQLAYVANGDSGTVSVIDLTKNTVAATIPIAPSGQAQFGGAVSLAVSPNGGFADAVYGNASTVSVINTSTNLTSATVPVGLDTAGLAFAPDGSSVYVAANDLGGIAVINTATNRATLIVNPDIGSPGNLAFAPDGSALYVIDDESGTLEVIDPKTGEITNAATPSDLGVFDAMAVSPDGHQIYVGTTDGIAVVDTTIPAVINTIQLQNEPSGFAFSPDGTVAYAAVPDSGDVVVVDTGSMSVTATIPVGMSPTGAAVSGDGRLLYVADAAAGDTDPGFFVINVATAHVIDSTPTLGSGPSVLAVTVPPTGLCIGDAQGRTVVTIDEILGAVNAALNGCPGRFPTMSTLTR